MWESDLGGSFAKHEHPSRFIGNGGVGESSLQRDEHNAGKHYQGRSEEENLRGGRCRAGTSGRRDGDHDHTHHQDEDSEVFSEHGVVVDLVAAQQFWHLLVNLADALCGVFVQLCAVEPSDSSFRSAKEL